MKKMGVMVAIILIAVLAGCTKQPQTSSNNQSSLLNSSSAATDISIKLDQVGRTYNEVKQENPNLEYKRIGIPGADGECLGTPDNNFLYFFFGTQDDGPFLEIIGSTHGNELKCAGIVTTIGEMFPKTTEQMPLEQYFETIEVTEYAYNDEVGPGMGWIDFIYNDLHIWINTNDGEISADGFKKVTTMKLSYTVIVVNEEIESHNMSIQQSNLE